MTSAQITRLRAILTDLQLLQLASEFPAFRIPLKKLEMLKARDEFFQRHDGTNTRQLARDLGVPLSTAYNWLSRRSISTGKRTPGRRWVAPGQLNF